LRKSDAAIAGHVKDALDGLAKNGDSGKQALYQACLSSQPRSYPLVAAFQPNEFPLLKLVQDTPDIEAAIRQLKRERLKDQDANVYISPKGKVSLNATTEFDLMSKVHEFLRSEKKVFLLRGGSGSGKSAFNRALEIELWNAYKSDGAIPLFIDLPAFKNPSQGLIDKQLRRAYFDNKLIEELKRTKRNFVLICDGYDEGQLMTNLYVNNRLNQGGEWAAQMIITCRTEYHSNDYKGFFQPTDINTIGESNLFQEAVIAPFSEEQIQELIGKYKPQDNSKWDPVGFGKLLKGIPDLQDLAKNPFVLKLSMEVLPQIMDSNKDLSSKRVTRVELIDKFVALWLERNKKRLQNMKLAPIDDAELKRLVGEGFLDNGVIFMRDLAVAIYANQDGFPLVTYAGVREQEAWKKSFFSNVDGKNLLRESIPLLNSGDSYQFLHKSYLEYGLSLAVFDPRVDLPQETKPQSAFVRRMDTISSVEFGRSSSIGKIITPAQKKLLDSPLGTMYLAKNPYATDCLEFLVERAHKHLPFRTNLLEIIEHSKTDKSVHKAAANAITILVKAGIDFNGADLRNIRIQGADLSYGMFDSAQLDGADLREVNLRNIWLRGSNLSNARMKGARFGEYPYIQEASE
ncbi:Transducin (beta)-like 1 X-linked receptor 1, partial [Entomortierella chlamydospora]